jgi:uncharacterized membrane protein HdeD (DUF308 family)/predicted flap endonuclease-1-like 5' DNA nuclease
MTNQSAVEVANPVIPWWLVLIEGLAAIMVGILLFTNPAATMLVLIQFLGFYWLITGIFALVSLFWDRKDWGWKLFNGILGIVAGILIIQNPLWSTLLVPTTLAIVIGMTGIIIGIIQLIQAFKGGGWGIGILGALSILLGVLLIARPVIAGLAFPWLLGGFLVAGGILALFGALGLRNAEKQAREAEMQVASRANAFNVTKEESGVTGAVRSEAVGIAAGVTGLTASGVGAIETVEESAPASVVAGAALTTEEGSETFEIAEAGTSEPTVEVVESVAGAAEDVSAMTSRLESDVPDVVLTGNVDHTDPAEMAKFKYALEYVEGIGPVYAEKLKAIGLVTCLDLLKAGASRKGREEISAKAEISSSLVLKWVNHVDLYRIKGVGSEYADLMEVAGVDTVVELAQRNANNLYEKMNQVNEAKALVRKPPTLAQVEDWVSQAKDLPRVVTY